MLAEQASKVLTGDFIASTITWKMSQSLPNDGTFLMAQAKIQTRLCPHCANSIAVDAITCPYCKADLLQSNEPEWPERDEEFERPRSSAEKKTLTVKSKAI